MNHCLICLERAKGYHDKCLKKLFGTTKITFPLPDRKTLFGRTIMSPKTNHHPLTGFSISGVQQKAQAQICEGVITIVGAGGNYIIKPTPDNFPLAAENEQITQILLRKMGIQTVDSGLIPLADEYAYITKRYDREAKGKNIHQEDMLQAFGIPNNDPGNKYLSATYLDVLKLLVKAGNRTTAVECFKRIVCAYILANADYHLKNISLIAGSPLKLTPAYDFLNTAIYPDNGQIMALLLRPGGTRMANEMGNGYLYREDFIEIGQEAGLQPEMLNKQINTLTMKARQLDLSLTSILGDLQEPYCEAIKVRLQFIEG